MEPGKTVAHCASPFLERTMVWVYDQVRCLERYRPVVFTQAVRNAEVFPVEKLYCAEALPLVRRTVYRGIRRLRGTYAGYAPAMRREEVALVHAHFGQEGFRCLDASRAAGVPVVTTFYGMDVSALPRLAVWRKRFKRLFAEGAGFLAEGPHMAQCLVDLGCPEEKVRVQALGVDLDRIGFVEPEARAGDAPVVLMYAAFREKKGHIYGLRAFRRVIDKYPGVRMRVIGDGPLRGGIEREVRQLGMEERVALLGMQPHAACMEELRRATVLLYPSVTAADGDTEGGAPVALLEAMAAGLPVVSSRHADIPFVVQEGQCGLLAAERDVDGLAEALDALLGLEDLREKKARAGRAHVEAHHALRKQVRRLEETYDRLIGA